MFLHVSESIFIGIDEDKVMLVDLDPTPNIQVLSLVVDGGFQFRVFGFGHLRLFQKFTCQDACIGILCTN